MNEKAKVLLFRVFYNWLEKNRKAIDERWYIRLSKEVKKAEGILSDDNAGAIAGAMWILNMISNLGVGAEVSSEGYSLQYLDNSSIDKVSTRRFLRKISECLKLGREEKKRK
jgi:hypothetical protein